MIIKSILTFTDGSTLEIESFEDSVGSFQNSTRRIFEFTINKDTMTFDEVEKLISDADIIGKFVRTTNITDDEGNTEETKEQYLDFTIIKSLVLSDKYTVTIAQVSELEKLQKEQIIMVEEQQLALIEIADIIASSVEE